MNELTLSDFFNTVFTFFTQIQVWTGLSTPAFLWLIFTTYKAFKHASSESDSIMEIISEVAVSIFFWWLVGFFLINPLWNYILSWV